MSERTQVTKAAGIISLLTLISRICGFIRDVLIARFLGAGLSSDAFFVAFRIPNLLRRLFAEGSLSIAFIPVFTEHLTTRGKKEAFELASAALRLLSVFLVLVTLLGILLTPLMIHLLAPGFVGFPEKFSLTVTLTRIMFPYIICIGLVALCMGILNALGHFAAPALAPVVLNLSMIYLLVYVAPRMTQPVIGLALGVLVGGILQLALQVPFLLKKGFYFWKMAKIFHPGLKKVGRMLLPATLGSSVYQINILVGTLLASFLPQGSVSYLYYADRLVQFPLGLFAIATATAVLPSLSRQGSVKDVETLKETFAYAIKLVFFITMPAMVGLIVLRDPIITLLFKRGAFSAESVQLTSHALLYYSLGLWAFSAVRLVVSVFYALQDTRTPVRAAVLSVLANFAMGLILMHSLGHGGLALSTALASMLNLGLLVRVLLKKMGPLGWRKIVQSVGKALVCSAIMGVIVRFTAHFIIPANPATGTLSGLFWGITGSIGVGILIYGAFSFIMESAELEMILAMARKVNRKL
jgi:putative peptidoglycan lipid II flippase